MKWNIGSFRVWFFRGLVAAAAGLMVASAIMPWWTCNIDQQYLSSPQTIKIFQYGVPSSTLLIEPTVFEYYPGVFKDITPLYQTVLAWVYIAASVGLILFSIWLKGRKGRWLLGGIGLIYIAYATIAAFVVIAGRLEFFSISLQGLTEIYEDEGNILIDAALRFGYYLAYVAGGLCIALALLRNKIIGKPKLID